MSTEDNERFQTEIAKQVVVGMPLPVASQNLAKIGFSCDDKSAAPEITCTRIKDNILLYSCMQRVNIVINSERKYVLAIKPSPIACAGL